MVEDLTYFKPFLYTIERAQLVELVDAQFLFRETRARGQRRINFDELLKNNEILHDDTTLNEHDRDDC